MKRRQVTYARKRRDRCQAPPETNSSPLQEIIDPEREIDHSEMSRRMLKRSRRSGSGAGLAAASCFQGHNSKKLRTSLHGAQDQADNVLESFPLNRDDYDIQTPHPTLLTESQRYQLESSRGLPLSPNHKFSPVPLAQPPTNVFPACRSRPGSTEANTRRKIALPKQTSSSNLKENANRPSSKPRTKSPVAANRRTLLDSQHFTKLKSQHAVLERALASPFTSKPASPYVSPRASSTHNPLANARSRVTRIRAMKAKRALSDTRYNPNLPTQVQKKVHSQTAVNSPTQAEMDTTKIRRPSAPSAIAHRPDVASWFISSNLSAGPKLDATESDMSQDATGRAFAVDFNRPPSQLSYTSSYDDTFFVDALGMSTPFGLKNPAAGRAVLFRSGSDFLDSTDSESDEEFGGELLNPIICSLTGPGSASLPSERTKGLWLSDSLISPPTALLKRAYSKSPSRPIDVNVNIGSDAPESSLGLGSPFGLGLALENLEEEAKRAEDLKELFEYLDISFEGCSRPNISRTRSLDLDQAIVPTSNSPAYNPPTKTKNAIDKNNVRNGRDRRGTIRASDFQSKRLTETTSVEGGGGARRTRSGTIIGPARRDRSGTIVAHPPKLVTPHQNNTDVDMQDISLAPKDALNNATMSEVDELEDEMLLKGHWHDEDWVVAENPSPVVPRRKNARKRDLSWKKDWERNKNREKRQWKLSISTGNWGVSEHDEDDGEDDPLDLFK
ncbi:hypothetical protein BDZ94DRAFT_1311436 [Collybia nuda]|uniref:Uncharacterized protein n=1 Tax=Collybia nuda TaxID=64659 RepID=A0A9P6CH54_9AGAR|nr:hypothetical protein BDZ94DRAFT_1311436 [Collybia nuda]